jgi:Rad3-related DNA helicase
MRTSSIKQPAWCKQRRLNQCLLTPFPLRPTPQPQPPNPQTPISTRYESRLDHSNIRNYGRLVVELAGVVPDGLVVFFVSYSYMDYVISK